jgi:hypothetical protein
VLGRTWSRPGRLASPVLHQSEPLARRPRALRGVDAGSGTNLYPALLMLPWAEQILLTNYSEGNVRWLQGQIADDTGPQAWRPFS